MNYSTRKKAGGEIVESEGILSPPMHRQGSIETFTLVLPQCPRVRKHAVAFRYSGKQFLITVAYIISSNHSPFVSGRHPVNRQRISRLLGTTGIRQPRRFISRKGFNRYFRYPPHIRRSPAYIAFNIVKQSYESAYLPIARTFHAC